MIDTSACEEHFWTVARFAAERGLQHKLAARMEWLGQYANREGCTYDRAEGKDTRCRLFKDFAPHSFGFVMECRESPTAEWKRWFNGGLIHHGKTWGIHT